MTEPDAATDATDTTPADAAEVDRSDTTRGKLTAAETRVHITSDPLAPMSRIQWFVYRVIWHALVGACRLAFRVEVIGEEKIPADRPFILAPVHRSYLDFAMVLAVTSWRRRMRYLGKDTIWTGKGKHLHRLWHTLGGIPVRRGSADREALRTCIAVVENGEPLVLFPEGTRQTGPVVEPLFDGATYVQTRTGVPIVPVGIGGSEAAMPKGSKLPKLRKIVVIVGDPLEAPVADGSKARRAAVRDQTERLRSEVQRLFDEAQQRAGTPNPP
jgi:1-acyl-sn-glycerol-3-phosphate acyltransferase